MVLGVSIADSSAPATRELPLLTVAEYSLIMKIRDLIYSYTSSAMWHFAQASIVQLPW